MKVTAQTLRAVYTLLRTLPPFKRWKLPTADNVIFEVLKRDKDHASLEHGKYPVVSVNPHTHNTLLHVVESVAHEIAHMRQRKFDGGMTHNKRFQKIALQICNSLGLDPQRF